MGVKGLPQSGTGQASIFCGINAPGKLGFHFGPYPHSELTTVLRKKNIFIEFLHRGLKPVFANAYPKVFFDYINSGRQRLSVTSLSCLFSGIKLKNLTDLRRGNALSAEIDNLRWVEKLNYKLPVIKPATAARRLLRIASKHHFTLFEFFLTDHIGHGRNKDEFDHIFRTLDDFLLNIFNNLTHETTLIICSDHGNLENISIKAHTRNPAIGISAGKFAEQISGKIKSLKDIKPAILELYD